MEEEGFISRNPRAVRFEDSSSDDDDMKVSGLLSSQESSHESSHESSFFLFSFHLWYADLKVFRARPTPAMVTKMKSQRTR